MKTLEERLREKALPYGARVLSGDTVLVKDALAIVADAPRINAAAIRDAGARCETCEHFGRNLGSKVFGPNPRHECDLLEPESNPEHPATMSVMPDFFCAHHSLLTQPSEGKK